MLALVTDIGRWVGRRIGLFLLILGVLLAGTYLSPHFKRYLDLGHDSRDFSAGLTTLQSDWSTLKNMSEQSVASLKNAAGSEIDRRIANLNELIELKARRKKSLDNGWPLDKLKPATHVEVARLTLEMNLASQERDYLQAIRNQQKHWNACERIRQRHIVEYREYVAVQSKLATLRPILDFWEASDLEEKLDSLVTSNKRSKEQYDQCLSFVNAARVKVFAISGLQSAALQKGLRDRLDTIQGEASSHWLNKIEALLPIALGILATAIFVPNFVKFFLYFVLAPIATRKSPICLVPQLSPSIGERNVVNTSAVSLSVEVPTGYELVVKPSFFHSAPSRCRTSSRYVLNGRFLMTSLAAGMYNLTQVRGDEVFVATVSAGQGGLDELLNFEIGDGEAVCLRPSNLVGFIHGQSSPVRISSHWRLGSLQAWLTMQLRYLVFHGPSTIIVKGCRGVRMESAAEGKSIEQASTLGFSAHLDYSAVRTETAMAYLTGQKGLLRDSFSGQSGFFIFEEMPDPLKRSGMSGKGLEGVTDAVLKLFGV